MIDPLAEIRAIMGRKNWKPGEIARLLGCGKTQAHNIIKGRTELKWKHIAAICEAADVDINFTPKK